MKNVAGIILCGGHSSRMGRPKTWLPFGDEYLLPRIVRLLADAVSPIVVVASPEQNLPPLPAGVILTHDLHPDRGPLQGLAAGLAAIPPSASAAYVSSCDVPFLRPAFVRRMIDLLGESDACVPRINQILQPLAAVYRRKVGPIAEGLLASGQRSLIELFTNVRSRIVTADELTTVDPDLRSLGNVNTPEDYAAALQDICSH